MLFPNEQWRDVEGFEGRYQVSDLGRIKKLPTATIPMEIVMHQHVWNGYLKLKLRYKGLTRHCWVHRLVAQAFLPNFDDKPYVNHKDRDRKNNALKNLEWVTEAENTAHWRAIETVEPASEMAF